MATGGTGADRRVPGTGTEPINIAHWDGRVIKQTWLSDSTCTYILTYEEPSSKQANDFFSPLANPKMIPNGLQVIANLQANKTVVG